MRVGRKTRCALTSYVATCGTVSDARSAVVESGIVETVAAVFGCDASVRVGKSTNIQELSRQAATGVRFRDGVSRVASRTYSSHVTAYCAVFGGTAQTIVVSIIILTCWTFL